MALVLFALLTIRGCTLKSTSDKHKSMKAHPRGTYGFDKEFLQEYEKGWKEAFGPKIKRNYLVKEILLDMDDKTFNKLAHALKDVEFDEISTHGLIKEVAKNLPVSTKLKALIKHGEKIREIKNR